MRVSEEIILYCNKVVTVTQDTPTYQIPGLSVSVQLFTVERNKI